MLLLLLQLPRLQAVTHHSNTRHPRSKARSSTGAQLDAGCAWLAWCLAALGMTA
jgi:hypothetical protein